MINNIYANNLKHYCKYEKKYIDKQKKLLTNLSNSLLENQWLRIKYKSFEEEFIFKFENKPINSIKPNGLFFKKAIGYFMIFVVILMQILL